MSEDVFPDGVAPDSGGFFPNSPAPERGHEVTGEDLSWVGGPKGHQPRTATNPDGDMPGVSPAVPGLDGILNQPR
jgi:hypothetical protein